MGAEEVNEKAALNLLVRPMHEFLGAKFNSHAANVLSLAIGLQESRFAHKTQINGPARGYWQFEHLGGVAGVVRDVHSQPHALRVCQLLDVPFDTAAIYTTLGFDQLLAAAFARLNLYTDPDPLPIEEEACWRYYLRIWRPGKPHHETWHEMFKRARVAVDAI